MSDTAQPSHAGEDETRRDFLNLLTVAMGAIGVGSVAWPFIASMAPSAEVLALSTTEVDLSPIEDGQSITVVWQGNPVFVRHRTVTEIEEAEAVDLADLKDPEPDAARIEKPEWLVLVGVCPHLGCVPKGQRPGEPRGAYGGWFCPCHGSQFDTSGRIRKGPAPTNLPVPPYVFLDDTLIKIG
jgi:ubiquinol-cytochrome c reductase iron-sulfur subunit